MVIKAALFSTQTPYLYLDPCQEGCDGDSIREAGLPVSQRFKVRKLVWIFQQVLQLVTHFHCSIDVECHAHHRDDDHHDVQDVPDALEVGQAVLLDLKTQFA